MTDAALAALAAEARVYGRPLVRAVAAMAPPFNMFHGDGRAHLDLSAGPLILAAASDGGRVLLAATDAWGRAVARRPVDAGGAVLVTAPGWAGRVPRGADHVAAPTDMVTVVATGGPPPHIDAHLGVRTAGRGVPAPDAAVDDELMFFERLRTWMAAFPPHTAGREYQLRFAPLGLLELHSPYVDPPPRLRAALRAAGAGATP